MTATRPVTTALAIAVVYGLAAGAAQAGDNGEHGGFDGFGSNASGISAAFVSEGSATSLRPQPFVFGFGGRPSGRSVDRGALDETLLIAAAGTPVAALQVTAGQLHVHAATPFGGYRAVTAKADGTIGSLTLTLQPYPAPATGTPPLLSIDASGIAWQSTDTLALHQTPTVAGSASFTAMKITGTLLNGGTINVAGPVGANDALTFGVGGGYVRVTLDQQVTAGTVVCTPTCAFRPSGIVTDAVAIHLDRVTVNGHAVTGDIKVGEADATIGFPGF